MEFDMYLALSGPSPAESIDALHALFLPDLGTFALVDVAFDCKLAARLDRYGAINLFDSLDMGELADVGPRLVHLQKEPGATSQAGLSLLSLLEWTRHRPMLSLLQSTLQVDALAGLLRRWSLVYTDDGKLSWPFRFADTRVLPVALELLSESQQAMLHGIVAWLWPDRCGIWKLTALTNLRASQAEAQLVLNDQQFASFMQRAEADEVLNQLHEVVPEALYLHAPYVNHQLVEQALDYFQQHREVSPSVKLKTSLAALTMNRGVNGFPRVLSTIQRIPDGKELERELDRLLQSEEV